MSIITLAIKAAETKNTEDFMAVLETANKLPEQEQNLFNDTLLKIQWKQAEFGSSSTAYQEYIESLISWQ